MANPKILAALKALQSPDPSGSQTGAPDSARLDWIEANYQDIAMIEPPDAFPDRMWTIWKEESDEHLGRGKTFRECVDAAMQSPSTSGEQKGSQAQDKGGA